MCAAWQQTIHLPAVRGVQWTEGDVITVNLHELDGGGGEKDVPEQCRVMGGMKQIQCHCILFLVNLPLLEGRIAV